MFARHPVEPGNSGARDCAVERRENCESEPRPRPRRVTTSPAARAPGFLVPYLAPAAYDAPPSEGPRRDSGIGAKPGKVREHACSPVTRVRPDAARV